MYKKINRYFLKNCLQKGFSFLFPKKPNKSLKVFIPDIKFNYER